MEMKEWINGELAQTIWEKKYRFEDETFDEWLDRVSDGNEDIRKAILEKKFLFGGRILANRGLNKKGIKVTYSNCYVLGTNDSIEDIYKTCSDLARTFSFGGGCGIDISKLRPRDAYVNNSAKKTSGACSFMDTFSQVTETIGQNGRRGALMISISCEHPDLLEFIEIKNDLNRVTKANISVRITDDFMKAVEEDRDWELKFETRHEVISKTVKAKEVFRLLCKNNWNMAEPGILYWDTIERWNLLSEDMEFSYAGVNPCAEEPLPNGGSCLLGSINLAEFVKNPFTPNATFDHEEFKKIVGIAVRGLNDVLLEGLPLHPLEIQRQTVHDWRQIGLGVMGIADMLIKLGIRYGSKESIRICDTIAFNLANKAILTSSEIARDNGTYPKYNRDAVLSSEYLKYNTTSTTLEHVKRYGLAHSQLLTIAPTGTLSTMLGISGGIEPIFNISYTRKTQSLHGVDTYYKVFTPIAEGYMKANGIEREEDLPNIFSTAMTLNYRERIDMQSIWQTHIDASISSTCNVPEHFTVEEVEDLYLYAWKKGLKGVTIFRDNCARIGVLTNTKAEEPKEEVEEGLKRGEWKPLAEDTIYIKKPLNIGCGSLKLFIGYSPSERAIQDIYIKKSSGGGCVHNLEAVAVALSGIYRLGGSTKNIEKAFRGLGGCNSFLQARLKGIELSQGSSCATAILKVLQEVEKEQGLEPIAKIIQKETKVEVEKLNKEEKDFIKEHGEGAFSKKYQKCPMCGEKLENSGGCVICRECSWSRCD